jgi:CheY-like chemotaxis protein
MNIDNKSILLIDDDVIVNSINKKLIESLNKFDSVEIKSNPELALEFFKNQIKNNEKIPGVILVDISMPVIDGFEFIDTIEEILEEHNVIDIPSFIILSGSKYKRDFEKFDKTPIIQKFLMKPLNKEDFNAALQEIEMKS